MPASPELPDAFAPAMQETLRILGTNVRTLRQDADLLQTDLKRTTGIGQNHLSAIENGTANITLELLVRLAVALRVSPARLLTAAAK